MDAGSAVAQTLSGGRNGDCEPVRIGRSDRQTGVPPPARFVHFRAASVRLRLFQRRFRRIHAGHGVRAAQNDCRKRCDSFGKPAVRGKRSHFQRTGRRPSDDRAPPDDELFADWRSTGGIHADFVLTAAARNDFDARISALPVRPRIRSEARRTCGGNSAHSELRAEKARGAHAREIDGHRRIRRIGQRAGTAGRGADDGFAQSRSKGHPRRFHAVLWHHEPHAFERGAAGGGAGRFIPRGEYFRIRAQAFRRS